MRLLLTIVLCMLGYGVFAQHQITGVVKNADGETIPNSHVDLSSNCVDTDASGTFIFTDLQSGSYTLKVSADGYGVYQEKIQLNQSKEMTIVLEVLSPKNAKAVPITVKWAIKWISTKP